MNNTRRSQTCCNRRQWLRMTAGAGTWAAFPAWAGEGPAPQQHSPSAVLVRELAPAEAESAQHSPLVACARQLKRAGGHNCAELILTAAIKCYDLPRQTGEAAAAFGGGVGHGELCGFLTGASMALGAISFKGGGERAEVKKRLKVWNEALWTWWKSVAPLNCRDLRPHYDKIGFENMMTRVCLQVEKIVGDRRGAAARS